MILGTAFATLGCSIEVNDPNSDYLLRGPDNRYLVLLDVAPEPF